MKQSWSNQTLAVNSKLVKCLGFGVWLKPGWHSDAIFCHWVIHQNSCFFLHVLYKSVYINHWPHSCTPSPCVNAAICVPWCPGIATPRNRGSVGIYIHFLGPYNRGCLRLYNQLGRDYVRHVFRAVLIFLLFRLTCVSHATVYAYAAMPVL